MPRPRDVVTKRPTILFVGINPGATSGKVGHHFAGPGNPFYRLLHASGLTSEELVAAEDQRLVEWNYALVNLVARTTKTAAELTRAELVRGRKLLLQKIKTMKPAVVALVGVTLYPVVFGKTATPGPGPKPEMLEGARVFVVPKLQWFIALREFAFAE